MNDVLNITDLSRTFQIKRGLFGKSGVLRAVADVDVKLERNEVLGIVGEFGSGKSTLAKMILGLITPSKGSIEILGQDLTKQHPRVRARQIQPVFQDPYSSLNPRKTINQIVTLPLAVQGNIPASERHEKAIELIRQVGLTERHLSLFPNEVSGGQRQRVAIARALILRPEIVLLDEPTSALDVSVQSQIPNLLNDLRREMNLTYVFISHNLAVIEYIATRVAVMYLGKLWSWVRGRIFLIIPSIPIPRRCSIHTDPGYIGRRTNDGTGFGGARPDQPATRMRISSALPKSRSPLQGRATKSDDPYSRRR